MRPEKIGNIRLSQLGITGNLYQSLCEDLKIVDVDPRTYMGVEKWFIRIPILGIDVRFGLLFENYGTSNFKSDKTVGLITKSGDSADNYIFYGIGSLIQVIMEYTHRSDAFLMEGEVWDFR